VSNEAKNYAKVTFVVWSQQTQERREIMNPREILLKMLEWIAEEQKKARKPGGESFEFTSLTYCASKVGAGGQLDEVVKLLRTTAKAEGGTADAVRPHRAIFLINRTLVSLV
jgi:hypothetical protein